ncbi:peptidoglycan DD-metalloendopeptidase family protein [Candidatus Bathyarchaeota archaeon]|nr:peptidoglycan DD-metalloendopeptidase family protein [Candidatus Bathyarchaeota archaeon]
MSSKSRLSLLALVIVGIVAIGSAGSFLLMNRGPDVTTTMTGQTWVTTRSATSSLVVIFRVFGKVFFDYNGNGRPDPKEPDVPNVVVALDGRNVTATNSTGWYVIDSVPQGSYRIRPYAPKNFRYMCESAAEFRRVEEGYRISVINETRKDIGLMEGFLTLPFQISSPIDISDHFDHDPGIDGMWWNGRRLVGSRGHSPPHTHPGIDFVMPKGTVLVAAVSGKVTGINTSPNSVYWIAVSIQDGYGMTYLHIEKPLVTVGTYVERGQPIALSGDTGSPGSPHLEFQLWRFMSDGKHYCIDPYSPIPEVPKGAWIAGDWQWYPSNETWVSQGYWTRLNQPQYLE